MHSHPHRSPRTPLVNARSHASDHETLRIAAGHLVNVPATTLIPWVPERQREMRKTPSITAVDRTKTRPTHPRLPTSPHIQ